jgi:hypothetical protein
MDAVAVDRLFEVLRFSWEQLALATGASPARGATALSALNLKDCVVTMPLAAWKNAGSMTPGHLRVNGVEIPFDPASIDLLGVLDAIDGAEAGVMAAYNDSTGRVLIAPRRPGGRLTLESAGTGFFTGIGMIEGTYLGATEKLRATQRFVVAFGQLAELLVDSAETLPPDEVAAHLAGGDALGVGGCPVVVNAGALLNALRVRPGEVDAWAAGDDEAPGALLRLSDWMETRL